MKEYRNTTAFWDGVACAPQPDKPEGDWERVIWRLDRLYLLLYDRLVNDEDYSEWIKRLRDGSGE